jgi:hypothetical protein
MSFVPLKKLVKKKEKNAVLVENKEEKNGSNFMFTKGRYCFSMKKILSLRGNGFQDGCHRGL